MRGCMRLATRGWERCEIRRRRCRTSIISCSDETEARRVSSEFDCDRFRFWSITTIIVIGLTLVSAVASLVLGWQRRDTQYLRTCTATNILSLISILDLLVCYLGFAYAYDGVAYAGNSCFMFVIGCLCLAQATSFAGHS
eukprot:TRINITY_DN10410_c0_g1_i3.p1 TRINITY_DN10410_c0_g1~~TRINITY_DN10410_c0_g1_i3.p1  ORF type:complete len:140 (+),score=2.61 TRINITY_DN10410_c0_g1_i3:169-588(+)